MAVARVLVETIDTRDRVAKIAGRFLVGGGATPLSTDANAPPWERIAALKENMSIIPAARRQKYAVLWNDTRNGGRARLALAARSYETVVGDLRTLDSVLGGNRQQPRPGQQVPPPAGQPQPQLPPRQPGTQSQPPERPSADQSDPPQPRVVAPQ